MKKLLIPLLLLLCMETYAINYTWNGTDNLWANSANWLPAGVPGAGDVVNLGPATTAEPHLQTNVSINGLTASGNHQLLLNGFALTVNSVAAVTLTNVTIGSAFTGGGTLNITAPSTSFTNVVFTAAVSITKNGAAISSSSGCTYNGALTIHNNIASTVRSGDAGVPDIFNDDVTLNNNNGGAILMSFNSVGNMFNRNVWLNSPLGGSISFGTGGGTAVLAAGYLVAEGATGFLRGTLDIRNFTQLGTTAQSLDLSWGGPLSASMLILTIGPGVTFNGNVNFTASNILVTGTTFNGTTTALTKVVNGGSLNSWGGGNMFNSVSTVITNATGTSEVRLAVTNPDVFNGNVQFHRTTSGGIISPAFNGVNQFFGNVTVSSSFVVGAGVPVSFGNGTGIAQFSGGASQTINKTVAIMAAPVFSRFRMNKTLNNVTLNSPVNISAQLDLQNGLIVSSAANAPTLLPGAITTIGNANSYVNGPMNCQVAAAGNTVVNFPLGKSGDWRPAVLLVNHSDAVNVNYSGDMISTSAQSLGYTMPPTVSLVSLMRYWQIDRQNVNNFVNANVTLYYDANDGVTGFTSLTVVKTNGTGTVWNDVGGTATANITGSITSGLFTTFSRFTIGNLTGGNNPLPVEFTDFNATCSGPDIKLSWTTATETDNDFFTVEFSSDGQQFVPVATVDGAGNSTHARTYSFTHASPEGEELYYRIRQTDFNGSSSVSGIRSVHAADCSDDALKIESAQLANGWLMINCNGTREGFLEIFAADGREMYAYALSADERMVAVPVDSWAPGVYWIRLSDGYGYSVKQVVK